MPTEEHMTNNEVTQPETKTKPFSFSEAVGKFRSTVVSGFRATVDKLFHHEEEPQEQAKPAPIVDLKLKNRRYDTPTDFTHSAVDDKERYPNETLAELLYEKTGQQYTVADDDVKIRKRSEAVKTLEFYLNGLKIEDVSNKELGIMLKKKSDQEYIVIPDDHSMKVIVRSDAIDSLRKLIKRGVEKKSLAKAV